MKTPVSVLVMTLNEERNLARCLESLRWADEIFVLDSESSDRTVAIAKELGCRVYCRRLMNWSGHQNWALENLAFRNRWVLNVDADEVVTPQLAASIAQAITNPGNHIGFRFRRRDFLEGRWLKHVQATPTYLRLYQPARIRFERLVNPRTIADGPVGEVDGYLDHYPFSKGYSHWLDRHNSYSSLEALQIIENGNNMGDSPSIREALFSPDPALRKYHQKEIFYRLPARYLIKFLLLYFIKLGFLDGRAGLTYASLQSIYEYMITLKYREYRAAGKFTRNSNESARLGAN